MSGAAVRSLKDQVGRATLLGCCDDEARTLDPCCAQKSHWGLGILQLRLPALQRLWLSVLNGLMMMHSEASHSAAQHLKSFARLCELNRQSAFV
jgi:hypothetical protein